MRPIPASLHRMLDFATIAAFALAPAVLGLSGFPATLAYLLAVVHLAMTLLTRASAHQRGPVSFRIHGAVECIVGVSLIGLPWLLRWRGTPRAFFLGAGLVILVVWALSRYRVRAPQTPA